MPKFKGNLKSRLDQRSQRHQADWRRPVLQMSSKPQARPARPARVSRVMSDAASTALALIGGWRVVRVVNGWGYYWLDAAMHGVAWIEKRVIDELKSFKAIRDWRGVLVTEQQYKLAKVAA